MAHELVRAETDRLLLEAVVSHSLHVLLGHDPARARHQAAVEVHEVGPGLVEVETDAVGPDDLDVADLLAHLPGALAALEAEFHVLGREGIAVVELQSLAQLELVDALIRAHRPRLREARRLEIARHRLHQRIVKAIEDPEGRELADDLAGIEPEGRQRDVERPPHLAFRLGLGGGGADESADEHGQRHQRHRHDPPSSLAHPHSSLTMQTLARLT
ncbi:MAG: hypothetical protein AUH30_02350 [Candidatus Rokubacteria bacterium 13_1_40CM_68_15]|nr:MAG: hypothetical protein AUH30_02350 [Candidatus Rokubacteria bacterium 13_1_40CM_68_15]